MKKYIIVIFITLTVLINQCGKDERIGLETINIGAVLSLSGSAAKYGKWTKNGIELGLKEYLRKNKLREKINIIYEDDATKAGNAVSAVNKLIFNDKVKYIIGPITSSNVLSVTDIAERNKVILFTPCASNPAITNAGKFIFRNWPSDIYEGEIMAKYIVNELKIKKIAVVYMNNEYGIGIKDIFINSIKELGANILLVKSFKQDQKNFGSIILNLKKIKPDLIYVPGHAIEVSTFVKQCKEKNILTRFASSVAFGDPVIFNIAQNAVENTIFSSPLFEPSDSTSQSFSNIYQKEYKEKPEVFAAHAYDAIQIILSTIIKCGLNTKCAQRSIIDIKNYPGVTGLTTFDDNGDVIKPIAINIVKKNKFELIRSYH